MSGIPLGNQYDKYNSRNPISRMLMAGFLRTFDRAMGGIQRPLKILEVGCGDGVMLHRTLQFWGGEALCIGMDLGMNELRETRKLATNVSAVGASATALPFGDSVFDLVLVLEVLEHLDHVEDGLLEIARVGRRDFLFSVPREPFWRIGNVISGRYIAQMGNTPGHVQHWSRHGIVRSLAAHFFIARVYCPFPWTMVACRRPEKGDVHKPVFFSDGNHV